MTWLFLLALAAPVIEWRAEHARPDPFGATVAVDKAAESKLVKWRSARGAYASAHLVVRAANYTLTIESPFPVDVYREWFHQIRGVYYPDALIPATLPVQARIPDPDNKIEGQTAQAYWVDVWVPADAKPGTYTVTAKAGSETAAATLTVTQTLTPSGDTLSIDHNSYGSSFLAEQYPKLAAQFGEGWTQSDAFFELIHAYHRLFYEHRGIFHQLGYGHGGKVAPEFAPELTGSGRNRKIASWSLYDRHYGPLLDGSAFAKTRRGAQPIPFVYLPITPEWPASFVNWGEPGYETEFVNVVREMEKHFREKGWTKTRFELFFNHKKRYKAFPWDGDEVRFLEDDQYFKEYWRLWRAAIPSDTPVKFVFRSDSSWALEQQVKNLEGIVNFWVCSSGMLSWMPQTARQAKARGDIVWHYSGPPAIQEKSTAITQNLMRAWVWDIDGYIHWLTVAHGRDPWFASTGSDTGLVYSGERFGMEIPLASIRLKLQRNALQDLAVLDRSKVAAAVKAYNGTTPDQWWNPRPAIADGPPNAVNNADIGDAARPANRLLRRTDAAAWQRLREVIP